MEKENQKTQEIESEEAFELAAPQQQQVVKPEDFDWDAYENGSTVSSAERGKLEEMYSNTLSSITENEVVDGTIVAINKREALVNIGYKSEGVISMNEFRYNPDIKVGDTVEVYVESQEDRNGQLSLSHKKARALRSWDRVNQALELPIRAGRRRPWRRRWLRLRLRRRRMPSRRPIRRGSF
jgi:small subunit ribosomal protein S1